MSHSHLFLSTEDLRDIHIRNDKECFVSSLPKQLLSKPILKSKLLFAQFGDIVQIRIHEKLRSSTYDKSRITITFNNQQSAQLAINWVNSSIFKFKNLNHDTIYWKSRSMNGLTKYCHSLIYNKRCFYNPCYYRHSLCDQNDVISTEQYLKFKGLTIFNLFLLFNFDHDRLI